MKGSVNLKEMLTKKFIKCFKENIIGISSGIIVGLGIGTALGLGVNCKITKSISPSKKGAIVALGALGEMMTKISDNMS